MWAAILIFGVLPPPSDATLRRYSVVVVAKPSVVYPRYVFRVWESDWCKTCQSAEWKQTVKRLDALPGIGIQRVNYDKYRAFARKHKITAVPAIQLYEVRGRKLTRVVAVRIGRISFTKLRRLIPP